MKIKEIATYIVIILVGIIVAQHMNVVVSGSMEPVLQRGDIVIVDNNPDTAYVGDIIVYRATWSPKPVIHRIIYIGKTPEGDTFFVTKGDNNPSPDPVVVHPDQVISKAVSINDAPLVIPKVGYVTLWIRGL
ncbi:MAG: signal peptidase I [Methanobacteriaceae archaeon]